MIDVVIIGSGIAGLACARRLADAGMAPVVLDKGRGIGGRVATRRVGAMQFDHGAQYVTAKGAGFAALLDGLEAAGVVADWGGGAGRERRVGIPGMSALPKALGVGLDIRQGVQVTRIVREADAWAVHLAEGVLRAGRVVVTVPAPQVAGVLGDGVLGEDRALARAVADVRFAPCLTLMAAVDAAPPFASRQDRDDPLSWIALDSSKPDRPDGLGAQRGAQREAQTGALWVAQAGEAFSRANLELEAPAIAAAMLALLCDRLEVAADRVTYAAAHRWRHARVTRALGEPFLRSAGGRLHLGGDWCLGPRVEAAWDSGRAIADDILARA